MAGFANTCGGKSLAGLAVIAVAWFIVSSSLVAKARDGTVRTPSRYPHTAHPTTRVHAAKRLLSGAPLAKADVSKHCRKSRR
jgi:hypothetical protein